MHQYSGAIAISGGRFSEASVSILVGSVECNGSESGLLECVHVTGSDEAVTQCDPSESAAVACQSKSETVMLYKNMNVISLAKVIYLVPYSCLFYPLSLAYYFTCSFYLYYQ